MAKLLRSFFPDNQSFSLSTRLFLLVGVLSLGPLLATNAVGYLTTYNDIERLSNEALANSATIAAMQTHAFVDQKRRLIPSLVAGNEHLRTLTSRAHRLSDRDRSHNRQLLHAHLRSKAQEDPDALEFYVLAPSGGVLGTSSPDAGSAQASSEPACRGALDSGGAQLQHGDAEPVVVVADDIVADGQTLGTFCARFRFDVDQQLRQLAASHSLVDTFHIADASGQIVSSSTSDRVDHRELGSGLVSSAHAAALRANHAAGLAEAGVTRTMMSGTHLAAVAPIPEVDWFVVSEVPEAEAFASLHRTRTRIIVVGLGLGLIVIVGMSLTITKTVEPLEELVDATRQMQQGRLDQKVEARGPREIAEMARVFNRMSSTVADLHTHLEQRVEQRTCELRQNQAFSELLFNAMGDNILVVDDSLQLVKANAAARRTYGALENGVPCYMQLKSRQTACEGCPVRQVLTTGEPVEAELVHQCRGRSEIMNVKAFALPQLHEEDSPKVLLVTRAVTDEKQRQANMVHHEKMSAFALLAAGVAHEVGNPLASIKAQVHLATRLDDPDLTRQTLSVVDQEVTRIERLLRQLTCIARRKQQPNTLVSWNQVARDVRHLLRHDPRSKRIDVELDLDADLPGVQADEDGAAQVLINLGLNAVAAIEGPGTVTIQTRRLADAACISVHDTGPGVAPEVRQHIFEPYFTTKEQGEGTGLGLFVSRRIISEMGGQLVLAESSAEGGASFEIRMPLASQSSSKQSQEASGVL